MTYGRKWEKCKKLHFPGFGRKCKSTKKHYFLGFRRKSNFISLQEISVFCCFPWICWKCDLQLSQFSGKSGKKHFLMKAPEKSDQAWLHPQNSESTKLSFSPRQSLCWLSLLWLLCFRCWLFARGWAFGFWLRLRRKLFSLGRTTRLWLCSHTQSVEFSSFGPSCPWADCNHRQTLRAIQLAHAPIPFCRTLFTRKPTCQIDACKPRCKTSVCKSIKWQKKTVFHLPAASVS